MRGWIWSAGPSPAEGHPGNQAGSLTLGSKPGRLHLLCQARREAALEPVLRPRRGGVGDLEARGPLHTPRGLEACGEGGDQPCRKPSPLRGTAEDTRVTWFPLRLRCKALPRAHRHSVSLPDSSRSLRCENPLPSLLPATSGLIPMLCFFELTVLRKLRTHCLTTAIPGWGQGRSPLSL